MANPQLSWPQSQLLNFHPRLFLLVSSGKFIFVEMLLIFLVFLLGVIFLSKKVSGKNFMQIFFCQIIPQLYYSCHHPLSAFSGNGGLRY
jgi:hypothetical protein